MEKYINTTEKNMYGTHLPLKGAKGGRKLKFQNKTLNKKTHRILMLVFFFYISTFINYTFTQSQVGPLIKTKWDQTYPYNESCPFWVYKHLIIYTKEKYTVAGCGAIALSQIMRYYEHPVNPTGYKSYGITYNGQSESKLLINNIHQNVIEIFDNKSFNYSGMADCNYTNTNQDVADLVYLAGVASESNYGLEGTIGTSTTLEKIRKGMVEHLDFSNAAHILHNPGYTPLQFNENLLKLMKAQIDRGKPMIAAIRDPILNSGHAVIIDGYDSYGNFHINFGWGGKYNGFHPLQGIHTGPYYWSDVTELMVNITPSHIGLNEIYSFSGCDENFRNEGKNGSRNSICPELIYPENGDTIANRNLHLVWEEIQGASKYFVTVKSLANSITYYDGIETFGGSSFLDSDIFLEPADSIEVLLEYELNGNIESCDPQIFYTRDIFCGLALSNITTSCINDSTYEVSVEVNGQFGATYDLWVEDTTGVLISLNSVSSGIHILGPFNTNLSIVAVVVEDESDPYVCNNGQSVSLPNCYTCPTVNINIGNAMCMNELVSLDLEISSSIENKYNIYTTIPTATFYENVNAGQYAIENLPLNTEVMFIVEYANSPSTCFNHIFYVTVSNCNLGFPCLNVVYADYEYQCGDNQLSVTVGEEIRFNGRNCGGTSSGPTITSNNGGGSGGGGGGGGGGSGPGNPGGGGGGGGSTVTAGVDVPVINENDECQECVKELQRKIQILKNQQNGGN